MSMDTVQIEITNICVNSCANCSRFVPHVEGYFMSKDLFRTAVDSMVGYPKMVGVQGGEPLLHPLFGEFCEYLSEKVPKKQLGLWTTLPPGYENYREIICSTFGHIFINDHTRDDIYHHPPLVAIGEIVTDEGRMWNCIDRCWAQESWSASINPRGAWFCEIAGSMSMLFEEHFGWAIENGWWWRIPKDYGSQMEAFCRRCGYPANVDRRRSIEQLDDISMGNLNRMAHVRFAQMERFKVSGFETPRTEQRMAAYKDFGYRNTIAKRYGMHLTINDQGFWTPHLDDGRESIFDGIKRKYA